MAHADALIRLFHLNTDSYINRSSQFYSLIIILKIYSTDQIAPDATSLEESLLTI